MPDALIWGASGGIGSALVTHLKSEGWRVIAAARNEQHIPEDADFKFEFDAGNADSINQATTLMAYDTDGIELVIYAAGGLATGTLEKLTPDLWTATLNANLSGAYYAARSSLNLITKDGHLMIIGAYVNKITLPRMGAYAVAKSGLETMVTILQKENRKRRITLVRPPAVNTAFWENVPFDLPENALVPEQVAKKILEYHQSGNSGVLDL